MATPLPHLAIFLDRAMLSAAASDLGHPSSLALYPPSRAPADGRPHPSLYHGASGDRSYVFSAIWVPRHPFEHHSEAFGATFGLPPVDHPKGCEGTTEEHPIHLLGVTEAEFRSLLRVMLRPVYTSDRALTKDEWVHVLKLSTMWLFDNIRDKAINELSQLVPEPVSRILLSRSFNIPGWTESALLSLAQQDSLAAAELQPLGWDTIAKLIKVRESVVFSGCSCDCIYCIHAHGPIIVDGNPNAHPAVSRSAAVSTAALRRSFDFCEKIEEVFGTDLH
ncbi:hypothetical protein C8Q74DRAFT_1212783 [Fomes fomentarius]|nr:hypothetical protein C8Q74DRAFT_1212783 [Fomes fomentarius]